MKRLAILSTHPIQYNAPVFQCLAQRAHIQIKVFYTRPQKESLYDEKFGQEVIWDIPLLQGYDYAFQPARNRREVRALIRQIQSWAPHALLVYGWNPPGHFALMRHFKGKVPVWFRGDSTLLDEQPGLKQLLRRNWLRWVYRHVDKAFYVGTQNQCYFRAHGLRPEQLVFAPHAIDNDRFADGEDKQYEAQARAWREKLGITPREKVILFAGKFERKKAPDLLLNAFLEIETLSRIPVHLIFAGTGELEVSLKEKAGEHQHIHFIGFQNQSRMPVVYRLGDVFCLPSRGPGETWGLAVNEAMACGLPVIVSKRVGCAPNMVIQELSGFQFCTGDQQALQDQLNNFLSLEEKEITQIRQKALEVVAEYHFDRLINEIERVIHSVPQQDNYN